MSGMRLLSFYWPSLRAALGMGFAGVVWMLGVATALWGCSRDPTPVINREVHAGKVLKRKAGRVCACAFYPLHDCEITLKIDSSEEERKFVPSVVIAN